ncbi:MAG: rRNA maturation RNase YbeY [Micavibrio sp.]|nr:rRNA maturation RNase YbeY [Micavibrio sp.]
MITLTIYLEVASKKWQRAFVRMPEKIEQAAAAAFLYAKKPRSFDDRNFEICITLSDDRLMKDLNHTYRGKNMPTNVLSFPQFKMAGLKARDLDSFPDPDGLPLGDVVLAHSTIKKECKEQGKTLENHVIHLVVHGTLHLLGYDHMKPAEARKMEKLECDILQSLGYPDPYQEDEHETEPKRRRR